MLFCGVDCGYAVGKCVGVRHDGVAGAEVFLKAWMLEQEQCCVCGLGFGRGDVVAAGITGSSPVMTCLGK